MQNEQKPRVLNSQEYDALKLSAEMRSQGIDMHLAHPERAFILRSPDDTASLAFGEGDLAVFSSAEKAQEYIRKTALEGTQIKDYAWGELVEKFGEQYARCLIDHTGEPGFYGTAPLIKDI